MHRSTLVRNVMLFTVRDGPRYGPPGVPALLKFRIRQRDQHLAPTATTGIWRAKTPWLAFPACYDIRNVCVRKPQDGFDTRSALAQGDGHTSRESAGREAFRPPKGSLLADTRVVAVTTRDTRRKPPRVLRLPRAFSEVAPRDSDTVQADDRQRRLWPEGVDPNQPAPTTCSTASCEDRCPCPSSGRSP